MLIMSLFSWWYGRGWKDIAQSFVPRLQVISHSFSIDLIIPTLFAPWRRIGGVRGRSLGERFQAWADDMFSRMIGFVVRLLVLLTAIITLLIVAIFTVIELVIWPLLPISVPALIIMGIIG